MSYNKYTWTTGETITADKLNHLENGVAEGSGMSSIIIKATSITDNDDMRIVTLDKTWQEVHDAMVQGIPCYLGVTCPLYPQSICQAESVDDLNKYTIMYPIVDCSEIDGEKYCEALGGKEVSIDLDENLYFWKRCNDED